MQWLRALLLLTRCSGPVALADMTAMEAKYEYEYLIKYKNLSYLHVQWLSTSDIGMAIALFHCAFLLTVSQRR